MSKIENFRFSLISSQKLVASLSAGADTRDSYILKKYLTRTIQEGHMKDFECILGDSEKFAKLLIWYLRPVCDGDEEECGPSQPPQFDQTFPPLWQR